MVGKATITYPQKKPALQKEQSGAIPMRLCAELIKFPTLPLVTSWRTHPVSEHSVGNYMVRMGTFPRNVEYVVEKGINPYKQHP